MNELTFCSYCGAMCDPLHHECGGSTIHAEPSYRWQIVIGDERGITCKFETPPPNWFQKFMYKFLLDWKVKKL